MEWETVGYKLNDEVMRRRSSTYGYTEKKAHIYQSFVFLSRPEEVH